MLDRKLIIAIFGLLFLSACTEATQRGFEIADAEAAGIIMPQGLHSDDSEGQNFQIIEVSRQDMTTNTNSTAQLIFPIEQHLYFQGQEGSVVLLVEEGQYVREGDVLARRAIDADARLEIAYSAAKLRLEQFEEGFAREHSARLAEIADARQHQSSLELALLEIGLERFVFNSNIARSAIQDEVTALADTIRGEEIVAPFDGMVIFTISGPYNLLWNPRIITIVDHNLFFYQFTISAGGSMNYNTIRHGDIITLRSNERHVVDGAERPVLEFDGRIVTDSWASGERNSFTYWLVPVDMDGLLETDGLLNADNPLHTLFSMNFTAQIEILRAENNLTLPIAAVHAEDRRNFVFVYNEGRLGKRYVHAGLRGGGYVQIISGLEDGAQVVILR
ncbi:MAG: hypothetical protein FWC76_07810 [Defluviitaleaceae bacterium]|nr:hypothetical protein [Defluviitaleaceae bacterium]